MIRAVEACTQWSQKRVNIDKMGQHMRECSCKLATRWARMGQDGHQKAQDSSKVAQVGSKMEQEGGKMGTKKGQEGTEGFQVGPKMGQEGGKMGTQRGQEDAREAQVGPKSGQKKRDPKISDFSTNCGAYFRSRFGLQAVF